MLGSPVGVESSGGVRRRSISSPASGPAKPAGTTWRWGGGGLPGWLVAVLLEGLFARAQSAESVDPEGPEWIWAHPSTTPDDPVETVWLSHRFQTPPYTWNAKLAVVADDAAEVWLNGKLVATCSGPERAVRAEVSMKLVQGDNLLAIRARNRSGPSGVLVQLSLGGTETRQVFSAASWAASSRPPTNWPPSSSEIAAWPRARSLGKAGMQPWGDVLERATATDPSELRVASGFQVELLRSATPDEGSWVCLAADDRGRLLVSPEGEDRPVLRMTLDAEGRVSEVTRVPAPIRFAMGLLFAHGGLYANAKGPQGSGLYRLVDTNGNDRFDAEEVRLLKSFRGGGEHGYHGLALGPEGWIYVMNGNGTKVPDDLSASSPYRHYGEDVLSLNPDETSRAGGALAPGGLVLRTDPEGRVWEAFAGGFRNAYGLDFNAEGELFTFDSDNEWDWGTPWYRPTRIYHVVSGGEAGWRDGTRAWADTYPDMMGSVVDIGIGSPCGVMFGTRSRFPEAYRRALFVQDWSYGRILAVHLESRGASYRGTFEEFVRGQPLNLTSMAFGADGALYFVTGGRGTQSGLYRVRYVGGAGGEPSDARRAEATGQEVLAARSRSLRRTLESYHRVAVPGAEVAVWPHLGSPDPVLRHAARVGLERQDLARWLVRAEAETNAAVALQAWLAVARVGGEDEQPALLEALQRWPSAALDEEQQLLRVRVLQLSLLRQGRPVAEVRGRLAAWLGAGYPTASWALNRELSRLLIWLEAPGVVGRTLELVESASSQEQQMHYVAQLRSLKSGWSDVDRRRYLAWWLRPRDHLPRPGSLLHWFHDVGREYVDGANVNRHLEAFRRDAIAALPEDARASLRALCEAPMAGAQLIPAEPRAFVQEWTMADLVTDLERAAMGRDYERGRRAFIDTQCLACHRLGNVGAAIGPELGGLAAKYRRREILESLIEPSKVISEQYQNVRVFLKDGEDVTGRMVRETPEELVIETDPLTRTEQRVARGAIEEIRPSTISPMPEGLLNVLRREEILDLVAYLEAEGRRDAAAFRAVGPAAAR